jgi:L-threonylcarbamoyladenylate synthase
LQPDTAWRSIRRLMSAPASAIDAAVAALRRGDCIGLPTETVYGLAADARNATAVRKIFALKGRPADHPLIVHLPGIAMIDEFARNVPPAARLLAARFWPGPLTLVLQRQPGVPDEVTGGQDTIGLRAPAHVVAQQVLAGFGGGLAAPSANRFGRISPTTAQHVRDEFGEGLPIVLDGGDCALGIESTIVDCTGPLPRILRPGSIGAAELEAVAGPLAAGGGPVPRVSGSLERHYAPRTPLRLCSRAALADAAPGVLLLARAALPAGREGIALPDDPRAYAHGLYGALRALDARGALGIAVESPPDTAGWLAVRDRLRRAAAGAGELDAT